MTTAIQGQIGKLAAIADAMRQTAERNGQAHTKLPHGLEIVMQRTGNHWRLALGREQVSPSDVEIEICRRTFGVPAAAEEERRAHSAPHPKTRRMRHYQIVEFHWTEREP